MRKTCLAAATGLAALASPALAHVGDHGETGLMHHLGEHGLAAGLIGLAIIAGGVYFARRRKG